MKPWIAYVRNATDEPLSLNAQAQACREALAAIGLGPVEIESDIASSRGKRPGLSRILGRAKAGKIAGLIVASPDRLSRSVADFMEIKDALAGDGVRLIIASPSIDTGAETGRFLLEVIGAVSRLEREFASR